MKITPKLSPVFEAFREVARLSRAWDSLVSRSVKAYGPRPQGGFVSGIYSEHFPQDVQTRLAKLARAVSLASDNANALRPYRVRQSTVRAIRAHVIATEGSGHYG